MPASNTTVKIFIASSGEVKDEREKSVLIVYLVNQAFPGLDLKVVMWDYSMVRRSYPEHQNFQAAINSKLEKCKLAVFIFYSKVGDYTKEEFDLAQQNSIPIIIFHKQGFKGKSDDENKAYANLEAFLSSLDNVAVPLKYNNLTEFEYEFYKSLNQYLSEEYTHTKPLLLTIDQLQAHLEKQQAVIKGLEERLKEQESNELKAKALDEVQKGDYRAAEKHLAQSAASKIIDAGSTFFELGQLNEIQLLFKEAYEYYKLAAQFNPSDGQSLHRAGVMANVLGYYADAVDYSEKSLKAQSSKITEPYPIMANQLMNLALSFYNKKEYKKAIENCQKALEINKQYFKTDHVKIANCYNNLGLIHEGERDFQKALIQYKKALEVYHHIYEGDHPNIAICLNNIGLVYVHKEEYAKAIIKIESALVMGKKFLKGEYPEIGKMYANLGLAYYGKGDFNKSVHFFWLAVDLWEKFLPSDHPDIVITKENLQKALAAQAASKK